MARTASSARRKSVKTRMRKLCGGGAPAGCTPTACSTQHAARSRQWARGREKRLTLLHAVHDGDGAAGVVEQDLAD
jgi:hypothetical protein